MNVSPVNKTMTSEIIIISGHTTQNDDLSLCNGDFKGDSVPASDTNLFC